MCWIAIHRDDSIVDLEFLARAFLKNQNKGLIKIPIPGNWWTPTPTLPDGAEAGVVVFPRVHLNSESGTVVRSCSDTNLIFVPALEVRRALWHAGRVLDVDFATLPRICWASISLRLFCQRVAGALIPQLIGPSSREGTRRFDAPASSSRPRLMLIRTVISRFGYRASASVHSRYAGLPNCRKNLFF